MTRRFHRLLGFALLGLGPLSPAADASPSFVLNHPAFPFHHATAMDQPRLYSLLTDGENVVTTPDGDPVLIRAFIDTGSSGFVLSNLHVEPNDHGVASAELSPSDYIGVYTNLGIGGAETGSVSRPFGVMLFNDPFPIDGEITAADFIHYGDHRLWVRQAPGIGEVTTVMIPLWEGFYWPYTLVSPVNIVGMPVIEQRTMVMEWMPIPPELAALLPELSDNVREIQTQLLPHGDPEIPAHNITLDLEMRDFVGDPPEGETLPSMSRNPLVKNVRISHDFNRDSVTAHWLFDTGAGSSFIGFNWAQQIGLIPESYANLESFVPDHQANGGMVAQIGGIGGDTVTVPILTLNEIRVPAQEGFDLVWRNVRILIFEHEELAELDLEGIFGMNLIGPAATIDTSAIDGIALGGDATTVAALLNLFSDVSPSPFRSVVFEVTGEASGELRLFSPRIAAMKAATFDEWQNHAFGLDGPSDPAFAAPDADPDGDGVTNLLEYALGRDPLVPSRSGLPTAGLTEVDGADFLTIVYERRSSAADLEFVVEASNDMADWKAVPTAILDIVDLENNRQRITVRDDLPVNGSTARFLRLRVEPNPAD